MSTNVLYVEDSFGSPVFEVFMTFYQRAVPVLQVVDVERSVHWYVDILGFSPIVFPQEPPYSFAMLNRDGAEIMLQCANKSRATEPADPDFLWSVYLRISGTAILDVAASVAKKTKLLRGPERMFYGMVEFELCDPEGYRISVGGEAPAGAVVKVREENTAE